MNFDDSDDDLTLQNRGKYSGTVDGGIFSITDSAGESSGNELQAIRAARVKRLKAWNSDSDHVISISGPNRNPTIPDRRPAYHTAAEFKANSFSMHNSGSGRLQGFSSISYDDDIDVDFPDVSEPNRTTIDLEDDPIKPVQKQLFVEEVDVEIPSAKSSIAPKNPPVIVRPVSSLADAMKTFKEKVAMKKSELDLASLKRDETHKRIAALREELLGIKSQIASTTEEIASLDLTSFS